MIENLKIECDLDVCSLLQMGTVCPCQSNPKKTGTDKEGNNKKQAHVHLPTPGDRACGSEYDPSPSFIKFGVQPC